MGKGKKKDKKKEVAPSDDTPSISTLSLSDTQPSTSHEEPPDVGLGLTGGRNKKKPQNKPPVSMEVITQETKDPEVPKPAAAPSLGESIDDQKRKEESRGDDDDDGLGLGISSKKNRRKKKKTEPAKPPTSVYATETPLESPKPTETAQPEISEPIQSKPQTSAPLPAAPQTAASQVTSWSAVQKKPEAMYPTPKPSVQPPRPTFRGQQPFGAGSGRGQVSQEQAPKVAVVPARPTGRQSQTPMCLFRVPDKIIGRSVPCRQIKVQANYLEMTIQPIKIYRYDVIFKPEKPKKFIPIAYKLAVDKHFSKIPLAFDQRKNVYSLKCLPGINADERFKCDVVVTDANNRKITIEVSFKYTGTVDLNTIILHMKNGGTSLNPPTEAIQAVDVILRQGTLESYVKAGRQFFRRPSKPLDLGDGLEMWTGLFQSAIFTSRPYVNVDVAHKGFPRSQLLLDAYTRDFRLDPNKTVAEQRGRSAEYFQMYLKGLKVVAYVGGDIQKGLKREFICNELVDTPRKMFFTMNEGTPQEKKCSVMDYFANEKKMRIRYPNMNCVWVGPKDKRIYYPMEFLLVSYGQISNKQLNEMQLSTLVKESATPPNIRKQKIEEVIADMNYANSEFFKKFGLDVASQFVSVDAKILQPPRIEVGGMSVEPRRGVWQTRKLVKAQPLESWGMISVETDPRNNLDGVINMIISVGNDMGMNVKKPKLVSFNVRATELFRILQTARDKKIDFLFVVISARGRDYYHKLKRTAEREVGILTQCIKEFTAIRKFSEQTVRNIMLKVNSKLMGINHALDSRSMPRCLKEGKTMLVGADVTHPSPDQSSIPSIAAVTASLDTKFTLYNITLSVQTPKKEMIVDFENMIVEHLNEFEKRHKDLPNKIYVFRDGVSEGQFAQVMNSELQAVHNAYKRKTGPGSTRQPEVMFLLVQKRHHTRFFLGDSAYNVEPGTVVDTQIVHPKEVDFYLVSHQAIKGTARPTRYHAVCNDGRVPQDEVEQLAYYLCHLYSRCTRAVSYPTPTYYAHLACMRARSLTHGDRYSNAELEKSPQRLRVLERILEISTMFFV